MNSMDSIVSRTSQPSLKIPGFTAEDVSDAVSKITFAPVHGGFDLVQSLSRNQQQVQESLDAVSDEGGSAGGWPITMLPIPSGSSSSRSDVGVFAIESLSDLETDGTTFRTIRFKNPYYQVGGRTYSIGTASPTVSLTVIVDNTPILIYLRISLTGSTPSASLQYTSSLSGLQSVQGTSLEWYCLPLYFLSSEGNLTCDFRSMVNIQAAEFSY